MNELPTEILRKIGRYIYIIDVIRLQIVLKCKIENDSTMRLRWRYEPRVTKYITCCYRNNRFVLHLKHKNNRLTLYDARSMSNRAAIQSLEKLFSI